LHLLGQVCKENVHSMCVIAFQNQILSKIP